MSYEQVREYETMGGCRGPEGMVGQTHSGPRALSSTGEGNTARPPDVAYQMERLDKHIEGIGRLVAELLNKLQPIMRPAPVEQDESTKGEEEKPIAPLARNIKAATKRLTEVGLGLRAILDGCEL